MSSILPNSRREGGREGGKENTLRLTVRVRIDARSESTHHGENAGAVRRVDGIAIHDGGGEGGVGFRGLFLGGGGGEGGRAGGGGGGLRKSEGDGVYKWDKRERERRRN